MSKRRTGF